MFYQHMTIKTSNICHLLHEFLSLVTQGEQQERADGKFDQPVAPDRRESKRAGKADWRDA